MTRITSRRAAALISAVTAIPLGPTLAHGATYAVRVRWSPSPGPGVAGYRVAVRALTGGSLPVVDAGLPPPATDGSLAAQVSGLDGRTDYQVTVTAYASGGQESAPSNAIAIGYAQVAGRIDSDGDGLTDAAEDRNLSRTVDPDETSALSADTDGDRVGDAADRCQGTAAGAAVNASGCSCGQEMCDDGNPCTTDACSNGGCTNTSACAPGETCNAAGVCEPLAGVHTIWSSTAAPVVAEDGPDSPVELGVKFRSDVAGFVTGVRFYKHALNTGTHVGNLWSGTGTRLATATFTGESASGWQQVTFSQPVPIAANAVYVASYHCPGGHYSIDLNYFATQGVDRPPLHLPANGVAGGNGVYAYGATSAFPTGTWYAANYWVDVVFSAQVPVEPPPSAYTIWPSTAVPERADDGDDRSVELGVKFRSDVAGFVTGLRFYKHPLNTGTHVGNLWSSTGTRLATATFTAESASGWQQVTFSRPVAIAANAVYVASYHCPDGHYSADVNYFAGEGVDRPPLHALASGEAGPNSVYAYGATSRFPTDTWLAANYWVDVVFSPGTLTLTSALSGTPLRALAMTSTVPRAGCRDDTECADQDHCTTGERCEAGSCVTDLQPEGTPCDDAHACTTGDVCLGGVCTGALEAATGVVRGRRFLLKRRPGGFAMSAIGQFAFPDGLDLATSGMSLVLEDGAHRRVLAIDVSGADLARTRRGWNWQGGATAFERLEVRPSGGRARVRLRGRLPAFDLVDARGASAGSAGGALYWRVEFGRVCSGSLELICTDGAKGKRRCRG